MQNSSLFNAEFISLNKQYLRPWLPVRESSLFHILNLMFQWKMHHFMIRNHRFSIENQTRRTSVRVPDTWSSRHYSIQGPSIFNRKSWFLSRRSSSFNRRSSFVNKNQSKLTWVARRVPQWHVDAVFIADLGPGRPKIIVFEGKNLHFLLKNLYLL